LAGRRKRSLKWRLVGKTEGGFNTEVTEEEHRDH
jgi:hypothetical protein